MTTDADVSGQISKVFFFGVCLPARVGEVISTMASIVAQTIHQLRSDSYKTLKATNE